MMVRALVDVDWSVLEIFAGSGVGGKRMAYELIKTKIDGSLVIEDTNKTRE